MLPLVPPPLVVVGMNHQLLTIATGQALMTPLVVLAFGSILLAGPVWFRDLSAPSASSDGDGSDGPGSSQPPSPQGPLGGGIPLPDAKQARWRLRDHDRPDRRGVRPRGGAPEPKPAPLPTLPDR
jgi:hypothetical protein